MRVKPKELVGLSTEPMWAAFNKWADENDVGQHPDDWQPWLECWMSGYDFRCMENMAALI